MSIYLPDKQSAYPDALQGGSRGSDIDLYLFSPREFYQVAFHFICEKGSGCRLQGVSENLSENAALAVPANLHLLIIDMALLREKWPISLEQIMGQVQEPLRVILLVDATDTAHMGRAINSGISGYLLSTASILECRLALQAVASGGLWLKQDFVQAHLRPSPPSFPSIKPAAHNPRLSERESQILKSVAHGQTHKEIAQDLILSEGSVRTYWYRVLNKLNAFNKAEAIARAASMGLLEHLQDDTPYSLAQRL